MVRGVRFQEWAWLVEIELVCSNPIEHRRRVDTRLADISGHEMPSWKSVIEFRFEPWQGDHMVLDTATLSHSELVDRSKAYVVECTTTRRA